MLPFVNSRELFVAFALGIAFAAPPGIVTAESVRRGLAGGFWPAAMVGFGSLIGDAVYAALALIGTETLVYYSNARRVVSVAGAAILFFLARSAMRAELPDTRNSRGPDEKRNAFLAGAALSLSNPWALAFWVGFGGVLLAAGVRDPVSNLPRFLGAFLSGATAWVVILSILIAIARRFVNLRLFRIVSVLSAVIFIGTGFYTLWLLF